MIKQQLENALYNSIKQHADKLNLPSYNDYINILQIERPRQSDFGDYAVNVSPLAKQSRMAPPKIADIIAEGFSSQGWDCSVTGGFVNFKVSQEHLLNSLIKLVQSEKPGETKIYSNLHCLLEFVSANPTGPLHIGHGRWVALGDSLGRILRYCGADVTNEFYINDAGNQIYNLANSIWYRCLEILKQDFIFPQPEEGKPYPLYPGEYVIDLAEQFIEKYPQQIENWDNQQHIAPDQAIEAIKNFAKELILKQQRELIERCRLKFDVWFSETTLHNEGCVESVLQQLKERGFAYNKDGAVWFASSRFGDDQDRVLVKSDGTYTYLTADIAYHDNKFKRQNGYYNLFINIWGADHHGYIPRMKAAMQALGHEADKLEIILGQLVNLTIDGERTRMGKRKKMLTLEELIDTVGIDAVRFWMISKSQDSPLDFNVDLAASASEENPVFYLQYAHARCASILRNAFLERYDTLSQQELPPILNQEEWQTFMKTLTIDNILPLFTTLENEQANSALKELILKMDSFEDKIIDAAKQRSPHLIARYALDLASDFHSFYNVCRILVPADPNKSQVRLMVIYALKRVLAQAMDILGVSAPEKM